MRKIVHLVPYDGIGGVETAARSMMHVKLKRDSSEFRVEYIFSNSGKPGALEFGAIIDASRKYAASDVDLLIVSLWRSYLVGCVTKISRPDIKLVVFLHSSKDAHWFDRFCTRLAISLADEVWADSVATMTMRAPSLPSENSRVISFVTRRFDAPVGRAVQPSFIFWGRIGFPKNLERALRIFASIRERFPIARFRIIGPDGGSLERLKALTSSLRMDDAVVFSGPATQEQIVGFAGDASFYLQTSEYEGMAMSVVEAMQLGLVPVVTAVGEIGSYCRKARNGVIVVSDRQAVEDVRLLLESNERYQTLRSNAIATWIDRPLYRECVLDACRSLLGEETLREKGLH